MSFSRSAPVRPPGQQRATSTHATLPIADPLFGPAIDSYIANKPRVVRSGKLIQKAKELYGDHQENGTDSDTPAPLSATPTLQTQPRSPVQSQQVIRSAEARFVSSELAKAISDVRRHYSSLHAR